VKPSGWLIHYKGAVSVNRDITFRFAAAADDYLGVSVEKPHGPDFRLAEACGGKCGDAGNPNCPSMTMAPPPSPAPASPPASGSLSDAVSRSISTSASESAPAEKSASPC